MLMPQSHLERLGKSSPGDWENWQIRRGICKLVWGPLGPLSKFRNHSFLVALSGGVKELRAFPAILHLSGNSTPVQRARPSDATSPELSHGTCLQPGPVDVRPSLWRSPLGASQKSGRLVEQWVDDRPESNTTRSDLGRLLSWRCTLGALFECDCHKELSQIQASSLNSLKFSRLEIRPGPSLNVT